jgi:hypothetical protein
MRTHTGEKPYICHVCNAAFIRRYLLTRHLRWHDDLTLSDTEKHVIRNLNGRSASLNGGSSTSRRHSVFTGNACLQGSYASDVSDLPNKVESFSELKSLKDNRQSVARAYGCGLCNEMFELEQEFLDHCSNHVSTPPDELFINLC